MRKYNGKLMIETWRLLRIVITGDVILNKVGLESEELLGEENH